MSTTQTDSDEVTQRIREIVGERLSEDDIEYHNISVYDSHITTDTCQVIVDTTIHGTRHEFETTVRGTSKKECWNSADTLAGKIKPETRITTWLRPYGVTISARGTLSATCTHCHTSVELPESLQTVSALEPEFTDTERTMLEVYLLGMLRHQYSGECEQHDS